MIVFVSSRISAICLDLAMHSPSLTLLLFSSSEMIMSTSLLCTEQWAAWSHHLCNTHWNVLMYDNISKRASYCISDSWYNCQKPTCLNSESELCWCMTVNESSSAVMWYKFVWTEHYHWTEQEWPLSERSEHTKQAAVDQPQEQNWHQCLQRQKQHISVVQDKSPTSCQLRDTYLYDIYMMIIVVVVAAELVVWESVLKYSIKKGFTYKRWQWRSWRRKKKRFEKKGERVYNLLHWQINWSELSKKIMCQQAIKILSVNLICMKQTNMCQQTMTIIQQSFQTLKTQPWKERKKWCHELNSY